MPSLSSAAPAVPTPLREQLRRDGGRLVIPVGSRDRQILTLITRDGDDWFDTPDGAVVFVPLIGAGGFADDRPRRADEV